MSTAFVTLEDSPMFQKQVRSLEHTADELRDRCHKLYKGSKKYSEVLGEACGGDRSFVASLEAFGGGLDDLLGVSIGGPVLSKFISALHELVSYKEFLCSQVEHVLVDRLSQFLSVDLQEAKESRRKFDKAIYAYDQAREKFSSLKKTTRDDIVAELEEDLHNSKSEFEKSRFNLVNALVNVEAKKKYMFMESFSAIVDAHLRYFKLGYDLLKQMEPFIHEVLTFAQQSKEQATIEQDKLAKRIQEYRIQSQLTQLQASNKHASVNAIAAKGFGTSAYKTMDEIMLATAKGEVKPIKQGYLLKRSSSLRADWKRRFFVLDSQGTLYYYRDKGARAAGSTIHSSHLSEHNHRVFGRFRSSYHRENNSEESLGSGTVDLRTSTIKIDAEDTDLRLCFRIISPLKTFTLQAESEADRIDWMNNITGVIASLLNSHLQQVDMEKSDPNRSYDTSGASLSRPLDNHETCTNDLRVKRTDSVSRILREVPGNDKCAECCAVNPDWASLNLGILMCIECSGIHRNLGVHISKVRSINLDVKVWEPSVLDLFQALGNSYCNSVWEELLPLHKDVKSEFGLAITKPSPRDGTHEKEKYIQAKYVRKLLVNKEAAPPRDVSVSTLWDAVRSNNLREVYRITIVSGVTLVNSIYDCVKGCNLYHGERETQECFRDKEEKQSNSANSTTIESSCDPGNCWQGCSLLHLACHNGSLAMLELLLQLSADINKYDFHGRTPLQHCILKGNHDLAKFLLRRGARASIKDAGGCTALERAMEMGAITDDELLILLSESD